jgi:hypothetical protein
MRNVIGSFLKQLSLSLNVLPPPLKYLYDKFKSSPLVPSELELFETFIELVDISKQKSSREVVVIVDAFDECAERQERNFLTEIIRCLYELDIKILPTTQSHEVDTIKEVLQSVTFTFVEIRASMEDIKAFVIEEL